MSLSISNQGSSVPSTSSPSIDESELNEALMPDGFGASISSSGGNGAYAISASTAPTSSISAQALLSHAPDIERLKSALVSIPPGDDLRVIAYHFLAPMAKAAIEFPEIEGRMKDLARIWACGELHDGKHPGLMAIKRGGLTGTALFEEAWKVFILDTAYKGPRRSLGSIYHVAKAAGWSYF